MRLLVGKRLLKGEKKLQSMMTNIPVEWQISEGLVDYEAAVRRMETLADLIASNDAQECVWLLEHPPLYTAGTGAKPHDLLDPGMFPVYKTGRGGQYTYHGPGQRVIYVMLNLKRRKPDVRTYVHLLERWIIESLAAFQIEGETHADRVGVWVNRQELNLSRDDKIAAIGIRVRRWVSFHGISINVNPDLKHFSGIVPCGISNHGVTSLADLGVHAKMNEVDDVLRDRFEKLFGPTVII
jgi:lipoyl(octanoyl) transferase